MFKRLFGAGGGAPQGRNPGANSAAQQAISAMADLTEKEEQLEKKRELLHKKIDEELRKAREFTKANKKNQALMCLKKKKMYEQQLERLGALTDRILEQKIMMDEQSTTVGVVSTLATAAHAQKAALKETKIENVDAVLVRRRASDEVAHRRARKHRRSNILCLIKHLQLAATLLLHMKNAWPCSCLQL
jgi:charged multivesicular body protein 4